MDWGKKFGDHVKDYSPLGKTGKDLVTKAGIGMNYPYYKMGKDYIGPSVSKPDTGAAEAENADILEKLAQGLPLDYAEEAWLADFAPALLSTSPELGPSELSGIQVDPRYRDAQLRALTDLEEQGETGLSEADKIQIRQEERELNRGTAGRRGALQNSFASRGLSGSGLELMAQLDSASDADDEAAHLSAQRYASQSQNRINARANAANVAGTMSAAEYNRKASEAAAADEIKRFNLANSINTQQYNNQVQNEAARSNADGRQRVASGNAALKNNFEQQRWANQKDIAGLKYNANASNTNRTLDQYASEKEARAAREQGLIGAATAIGGAFIASDKGVKKDIHGLHGAEIEDFLESLDPVNFKYQGTNQPRVGVIAQDVEKGSRIGSEMIRHTEDGTKGMDTGDLLGAILASLSYLHQRGREG